MSDFSGEVPFEFRSSISKMQSGYYGGVRVQLGNMDNFLSTSCVESLEWLHFKTDSKACQLFTSPQHTSLRSRLSSGASEFSNRKSELRDTAPSVHGIIRRGLSVLLTDPDVDFTASVSHPQADNSLNVSRSVTGMLKVNSCSQFPANLPGQSSTFSKQNSMELVDLLLNTDEATEQADIIHYLFITHGPDYQIKLDADSDTSCSVADLLEELYQKSGSLKMWWLVRYSAAMLRKKALSDLLVRQKQVTFGLPAHKECVVTQPISHDEIVEKIEQVCNIGSESTDQDISDYLPNSPHCMLHQELLLYMSMYVRTEPRLFHEMLRVRIGLVIAVMTKELSHCLNCSEEEATSHLLNLSPYELKNFLYHILSAKDFVVLEVEEPQAAVSDTGRVKSRTSSTKHRIFRPALISNSNMCKDLLSTADAEDVCEDSLGQWSRHRRIDGALNRVPVGFYSKIWHVLKQCGGLSVDGTILSHSLVKEMTEGELKFALRVESVLNNITEPEYRQLVVEALCALNIFSQMSRDGRFIPSTISVDDIVHKAYLLFLQDHGMEAGSNHLTTSDGRSKHSCHRLRGICEAFYDSAPSGPYGTIPYMCKAALQVIPLATKQDSDTIECLIQ
ncbi:hypothetical protein EB796_015340 [Bugula neritina]|uniref:Phosphorylase b kinase regulatory subunit n=1 Tax=Bugula neritina TaxID=10212 RepID=A0A7J7JLP9_BUGNE|nr:hypothetical protein EB796_015340 [Bugula neritina]